MAYLGYFLVRILDRYLVAILVSVILWLPLLLLGWKGLYVYLVLGAVVSSFGLALRPYSVRDEDLARSETSGALMTESRP